MDGLVEAEDCSPSLVVDGILLVEAQEASLVKALPFTHARRVVIVGSAGVKQECWKLLNVLTVKHKLTHQGLGGLT